MSVFANYNYFPTFSMLPQSDELDGAYFAENVQGMISPSRTWCFVAEIVSDALSQESVLGHRVEVRDLAGDIKSILFYPETVAYFDWRQLKTGSTIFIRYAQRCFFSDLATEAIKCEDLSYVKTIPASIDTLLFISGSCFGSQNCQACNGSLANLGGSVTKCDVCQIASYCNQQCCLAHVPQHKSYCYLCRELASVLNIDWDRFTNYVPFR